MSDRTTPNGRIITAHALISLLRHGFQEPFDLVDDIIENYSRRTTQDDGATVYIQRAAGRKRRYNISRDVPFVTSLQLLILPERLYNS
jgi:hypothetical protein